MKIDCLQKPIWEKLISSHLNARLYPPMKPHADEAEERTLTHTISGLPLQTLAVRKRDDIGGGVDAPLRTAAPHALHVRAGAVGTVGVQRTRRPTGWTGTLTRVSWTGRKR